MTMNTKSQLAVPLSQNTAPVFKFDCLYTHDLVRKQKRWQDGILAFHTFNKRVMVYDLTNNFIGDTHWRESDSLNEGDDLKLDRGVLVEVGEAKGRKDHDISEIFAKKAAPRTQASPLRNAVAAGQNARKPKSITAVLGPGTGRIGRANVGPTPSSLSNWSSPIEVESPRPTKRPRIEKERSPREVLAEKIPKNRVVGIPSLTNETTLKPSKEADRNQSEKPKEKQKKSPSADRNSTTSKKQAPKKTRLLSESSSRNGYAMAQMQPTVSAESSVVSSKPRQKLRGSKSRRKKLIFHSMSTYDETSQLSSIGNDREQVEDNSRPITQQRKKSNLTSLRPEPQEIILISSHPEDILDFEISDDDDFYITPAHRKAVSRRKSASVCGKDGWSSTKGLTATNDRTTTTTDESPLAGRASFIDVDINDSSRLSGLLGDTTLLAAEIHSPLVTRLERGAERLVRGLDGYREDGNSSIRKPVKATEQVALVPQHEDSNIDGEGSKQALPLAPGSPKSQLAASIPPSPHIQHIDQAEEISELDDSVVIPASPPLASRPRLLNESAQPDRGEMNASEKQQEISVRQGAEVANEVLPCNIVVVTEPSRAPEQNTDIPQRAFKALAPPPILNKAAAPITAPIPNQKSLPQFRPPQRITRSSATALAGNGRRSPLKKSLTASTLAGKPDSGLPISLARSGSDEGVGSPSLIQVEYDDTGPWSREAFDLFGWTPDVPKGKVLGPVASRGCGCRAAAAAAMNTGAT